MNLPSERPYPKFYLVILFLLVFLSCSEHANHKNTDKTGIHTNADQNMYAKGFCIYNYSGFKVLKVFNPWEHAQGIVYSYVLATKGAIIPDSLKKYDFIPIPVKKVVCLSTTHIAFLKSLQKEDVICGVSAPEYIYDQSILNNIENGKILNVGYDQALNIETIISLKPDFVMTYGVGNESSGQYQRLKELGIKVIFNAEYLERTPLGKAEWIKFVGAFVDCEDSAKAIFDKTEKHYRSLIQTVSNSVKKPIVLSGLPWKGVWYVPGGNSYASNFIKDAGGIFLWNSDTGTESMPLSLETVMEKANKADVWINPGSVNSLIEISSLDQRMKNIQCFKSKAVYNFNARLSPRGGNDFWESGVVHPDLILKDLIAVFHPELLPNHTFVYYKKLN
jgi:iron complex transport system substrate-binding protein